jgi:hypothetical protein
MKYSIDYYIKIAFDVIPLIIGILLILWGLYLI